MAAKTKSSLYGCHQTGRNFDERAQIDGLNRSRRSAYGLPEIVHRQSAISEYSLDKTQKLQQILTIRLSSQKYLRSCQVGKKLADFTIICDFAAFPTVDMLTKLCMNMADYVNQL